MILNGKPTEIKPGETLLSLLGSLGYKPGRVAAELNGKIIPREDYATTALNENDRLEIVCFVGGG